MTEGIVVIGTSLGGLKALSVVLGGLPRDFPMPVAIVQHRTKEPDSALTDLLQRRTSLPVGDVEDKMPVQAGRVYLAPPDYHLLVGRDQFALSIEAPVSHARPSVDVLFDSAASSFGRGVVAVVLTGANGDGANGAVAVKLRGGRVIVQDPKDAESPVMPAVALSKGVADVVLSLCDIAAQIVRWSRDRPNGGP
jgi:two-component system chemotaxis response regulator CheB